MEKKKIWHKQKTNHKILSSFDDNNVIWEFTHRNDMVKVWEIIDLAGRLGIIDRRDYSYTTSGDQYSMARFIIDCKRDTCFSTVTAQPASPLSGQSLP